MTGIKKKLITLLALLLTCLFLFGLTACQDNEKNNGTTNQTESVTKDNGEPADPNNQYAKDNNAYYKNSWSK